MSELTATAAIAPTTAATAEGNPLLQDWSSAEHGMPPFTTALPCHYEVALREGMKQHLLELAAIASNPEPPTFDNTIAALDRAGKLFFQLSDMFDNLCSSNGVPELQKVELSMAGPLASHFSQLFTYPGLFDRIDTIYQQQQQLTATADSDAVVVLSAEQQRLVQRFHLDFVRHGARFSAADQKQYAKITEQLAQLTTQFSQNILADESCVYLTLETADDLRGLPADLIASAQQAARERGLDQQLSATTAAGAIEGGKCIITLSRSLVEPFITFSQRRDLREKAWKLWTSRGELSTERDNLAIAAQILQLRAQQAKMHGYSTYADYATAVTMAGNPENVMLLLEKTWGKAKRSLESERQELEAYIATYEQADTSTGSSTYTGTTTGAAVNKIEPWDWRYYAEKVRVKNYDLDESEVKPYFPLNRMVEAVFDCAQRLFGLRYQQRTDIVTYHPDVKVYEVYDEEDRLLAIFLHDNYARPNKRSGAWMSEYRSQTKNTNSSGGGERVIPIVVNNNNFNKPASGEALLSFDDCVTLFHEHGHGLHGMLSDVTYRRLAGTSVLRDFVELPSQLFEHWLSQPEVLKKHARHFVTGESIPDSLLERLMKARKFNLGFQTVEYTASALVDVALHKQQTAAVDAATTAAAATAAVISDGASVAEFERQELQRLGMPAGIVMRHRPAHFQHLFASSGYASMYYVYQWAEVLDADGFDAFLETGDCFNPEVAKRVRKFIYSSGNSIDPAFAFRSFRGRDPEIEPMLKKKGLLID